MVYEVREWNVCAPVSCDAIAETVDTVTSDAASCQNLVGHIYIDGLQCRKCIALDLQIEKSVLR